MQVPAAVDTISTNASKDSRDSYRATVRSFEAHDRPPKRKSWQANQVHSASDNLEPEASGGGWVEAEGEDSILLTAASIDPERRSILQSHPGIEKVKQPNALKGVSSTDSGMRWDAQLSSSKHLQSNQAIRSEKPSSLDSSEPRKDLPPTLEEELKARSKRAQKSGRPPAVPTKKHLQRRSPKSASRSQLVSSDAQTGVGSTGSKPDGLSTMPPEGNRNKD